MNFFLECKSKWWKWSFGKIPIICFTNSFKMHGLSSWFLCTNLFANSIFKFSIS